MLEKTYEPGEIEGRIWRLWDDAQAFRAGRPERLAAAAKPYCIVIPPPNVTGSLHMGHALNNTLQDILCRFERMRGRDVLWQPGTDHAGIATQMVVERRLLESQQPDRRTLGREEFLKRVWAWKEESGGTIVNQLKRLGASCDWSRERFTMDEGLSKAVIKVFVELHKAGLIYKDKRLVNWDPRFQTAISDLEVVQVEHRGSFKWSRGEVDKEGNPVAFNGSALGKLLDRNANGHMYYFNYPLAGVTYNPDDAATFVTVATTRPETMLGDTAVAVSPDHPKYGALIGRKLVLPLVGRVIPIVGDDYADPEKGTGAVKITPAHDFNDFEVGKRHGLAQINIFDAHARINENAPEGYRGLDRFEARKRVVADMESGGYLAKIEPHTHAVPHGDRSGVAVEPWLTDQWYVDAKTLAQPALEAVRSGQTKFVPERYADDYFRWLDNIQPWCISRQLWWGHQIPAWYGPNFETDPQDYFVAETEAAAYAAAKKTYISNRTMTEETWQDLMRSPVGKQLLTRDPDVLDTWFSSALWPFSTLGWPELTPELARYYPTDVLVTGFDIIFFWVARMMMMGLHFMQEVPFHTVYIHALVRDEKGAKMSKSKGNVMDPLELIDQYGADALRFTMAAMAAPGRDLKLSTARVEGYRNFATKLWNATRFAQVNGCARTEGFDPRTCQETVNRWIAGETQRAQNAITTAIETHRHDEAATAIYTFTWDVFCDWYIELSKPVLTGTGEAAKTETRACVSWVLDQITALLHPFMPFLTEELWAKTGETGPARTSLLTLSAWPALSGLEDKAADEEIGWVIALIRAVRSLKTEMNVPGGAKVPLVLVGASKATQARATLHEDTLKRLARLETIGFAKSAPKGSAQQPLGEATIALPLAGLIDFKAERERLSKEIKKAQDEIDKTKAKLGNAQFMARAPEDIVEEMRERQADFEAMIGKLQVASTRIQDAD